MMKSGQTASAISRVELLPRTKVPLFGNARSSMTRKAGGIMAMDRVLMLDPKGWAKAMPFAPLRFAAPIAGDGTEASPYTVRPASATEAGVVRLSSAVNSASETTAATSAAVKTVYDLANGKLSAVSASAPLSGDGTPASPLEVARARHDALGVVRPDGVTTEVSGAGAMRVIGGPAATANALGMVKVDGVTTVMSPDGTIHALAGGEAAPSFALPVIIPVKGGSFRDDDRIRPRLHVHIRFFGDLEYAEVIGDFHTHAARFRRYCRVLNAATGLSETFPPGGVQAWHEYVINEHAIPELRPFGLLGSWVMVNVPELLRRGLLVKAPAAWAAEYIDHAAEPVAGSAWDFGVVPMSAAVTLPPLPPEPDPEAMCEDDIEIECVFFYDKDLVPGHVCNNANYKAEALDSSGRVIASASVNLNNLSHGGNVPNGGSMFVSLPASEDQLIIKYTCDHGGQSRPGCHSSITSFRAHAYHDGEEFWTIALTLDGSSEVGGFSINTFDLRETCADYFTSLEDEEEE